MSERSDEAKARFRVTGRVQGVGFRWSALQQARGLHVRGSVRNCADGSVEALVAGPRAAVERFRDWLEHGPTAARVERVEELPPPEGDALFPEPFQIAR